LLSSSFCFTLVSTFAWIKYFFFPKIKEKTRRCVLMDFSSQVRLKRAATGRIMLSRLGLSCTPGQHVRHPCNELPHIGRVYRWHINAPVVLRLSDTSFVLEQSKSTIPSPQVTKTLNRHFYWRHCHRLACRVLPDKVIIEWFAKDCVYSDKYAPLRLKDMSPCRRVLHLVSLRRLQPLLFSYPNAPLLNVSPLILSLCRSVTACTTDTTDGRLEARPQLVPYLPCGTKKEAKLTAVILRRVGGRTPSWGWSGWRQRSGIAIDCHVIANDGCAQQARPTTFLAHRNDSSCVP
jgi:hypothetical protein